MFEYLARRACGAPLYQHIVFYRERNAEQRVSAFLACSNTSSNTSRYALSVLFLFLISAKHASTNCTEVTSPAASFLDASVIESSFRLLIFLDYFAHDIVVALALGERPKQLLAFAKYCAGSVFTHHGVMRRDFLYGTCLNFGHLPYILKNI